MWSLYQSVAEYSKRSCSIADELLNALKIVSKKRKIMTYIVRLHPTVTNKGLVLSIART